MPWVPISQMSKLEERKFLGYSSRWGLATLTQGDSDREPSVCYGVPAAGNGQGGTSGLLQGKGFPLPLGRTPSPPLFPGTEFWLLVPHTDEKTASLQKLARRGSIARREALPVRN